MPTPPQSPSELRSPGSASGGGQTPFIYPIRSAVSVKPAGSSGDDAPKPSVPLIRSPRPRSAEGASKTGGSSFDGNASIDESSSASVLQAEKDHIESMTLPRFKHVATDQGHMVVTGREGEITRCEDEPIHIPGAVQSFGCMVVVREEEEGCLVVRQCSENTGDILGLPPAHLFKLESFLDCFDDDQADVLWDNIEMLNDSKSDLVESGPNVFQINGRGQQRPRRPGRSWKAWCAAHRVTNDKPKDKLETESLSDDSKKMGTLVVLEFELIGDSINPIFQRSAPPSPGENETEKSSSTSNMSSRGISPPPSVTTIDSDGTTKVSAAIATVTKVKGGLEGMPYVPTPEQFMESTQASSKPLKALQRMKRDFTGKRERPRRKKRPDSPTSSIATAQGPGMGLDDSADMLDMFGILSQVNEQFSAQNDLQAFLKVVVSIVRELTCFSRVMIYQFDEKWNGQVVCELVDWNDTHDLYRGLHFPATDIPKQARDLYMINKIRLLYDRDQPSARMVCREKSDLESPVDMTHSFLRAMSPIHIKYLANMGVRASMSISITAFDQLWGLISLHTYGSHGRRISFPVRQLCRLIGDSVSRNIERLSYTRRLSARKLINTLPTDRNPSGYIISNAEDLLKLFDADFGVIAIGNEAKILGPLSASQEVLAVTEYLRIKKFQQVITSQDVASDFPDMVLPNGLEVIAGLMLIPLSSSGIDFITFMRKAQTRHVNWAGKPFKEGREGKAVLEPRKSFKIWSEVVVGTCRAWQDEELETASVLCLVYGKFISVWRQREQAMQYNQLNKLLLSNATHEVRTPLNHIINYLEMALDSPLDDDTRENLSKSHMASKSLLFVINDLLDLTRHEEGNKLFLQEPFDLAMTVRDAVEMHELEAKRREIQFTLSTDPQSCYVIGDSARVRQIVVNTVSNSVKYTDSGHIHVEMRRRTDEEILAELPEGCDMEIELSISDTGKGIAREKLEAIFREFEQVESVIADPNNRREDAMSGSMSSGSSMVTNRRGSADGKDSGIGLGLAIVARIVKNIGGQLRVDSTVGEGSRFTYFLPFRASSASEAAERNDGGESKLQRSNSMESGGSGNSSVKSEINSLVEAISAPHLDESKGSASRRSFDNMRSTKGAISSTSRSQIGSSKMEGRSSSNDGAIAITDSVVPLRSVKVDRHELDAVKGGEKHNVPSKLGATEQAAPSARPQPSSAPSMSNKFAQGKGGEREDPPSSVPMPDAKLNLAETPEPLPTSTSAESGSSNAQHSGDTVKRVFDRRRARAQLVASKTETATPSPTIKSNKVSPLRVLVVEDDPVNRMILKKRLSMDGHSILLAVNGEEGYLKFESNGNEIDVVLMDLQMPICNGQDSCRRIRECEDKRKGEALANRPAAHVLNGRIPIFAVSATLNYSMRQEMCDIGMDGWLLKPIDFNRLRELLKGLTHLEIRDHDTWKPGHVWEKGGWLSEPASRLSQTPAP
ncbi:uncharacterized protein FA14DRAFT_140699 [Meira miltonrushii]|uniref:Phytochrome n=1 Tax=Meira miltonrushii TaxID=1280837 RepID=A0A316VHP2_9BASI|nr:uncharacterized protein FA14DRAFT_140699 [Meira miltonrushii]PWN36764.1 hypothetical protein FA14DRAFT_140699 [Meira miltonrushii]